MKRILIAILLLCAAGWAQEKTTVDQTQTPGALWDRGNDFLRDCGDNSAKTVSCVAYVMGTWDGFVIGKPGQSYCISDQATPLQLKRIVVKYISEHPEKAHKAAVTLVIAALSESFPCPATR